MKIPAGRLNIVVSTRLKKRTAINTINVAARSDRNMKLLREKRLKNKRFLEIQRPVNVRIE